MNARDAATQAQVEAARPDSSTWLAANAGSGKTRVLTDRVARLLLDGVEPQHILCLTYTKAAASEMQNRLFRRLGAWAMLEDAPLSTALRDLGVDMALGAVHLHTARTLFARAIETPGGLKIQTIHSFCASLLRRFPLEARVSPQFTEIEDRAADLLRAEIIDQMAEGAESVHITALAEHYSGDDFDKLTKAIVQHRDGFDRPLNLAAALHLFDQPDDLTAVQLAAEVFLGSEQELIDQIIPPMLDKGGNDAKAAEKLRALPPLAFDALPQLEAIFLTGKGAKAPFAAKIGSFPTKATQNALAEQMPALDDFMGRVETARHRRLGLLAAQKTATLHQFAACFLPRYAAAKTLRGWLDFDDLIDRARALLSDEKVAAWVLFRIDGGIDHILVDEAQDTSPAQWDVIRKLAAEFTSGQGARDVPRTIFVVGDKKQSIYSFQGADPREFDRMQEEFQQKLEAIDSRFQSLTLKYSFRSAAPVLDVVDQTFDGKEAAGFSDETHIAFKSEMPGRVDLWPLIEKQPDAEDGPWYLPLDRKSPHHHDVMLADRIASQIKWMIDSGQTVPDDDPLTKALVRRPIRAGDFLILVRKRATLFSEIIRACKAAEVPIAGADRLKVGGELAVRDLAALLSFVAMPEDSLALASALKSPLFGWREQDLFDLAHRRTQDHLWQAIRARAEDYPETMAILRDLRNNVDFLRPYDLIERILTRHKGRQNLLARLGVEAEDGINALLSQALAYERTAVPSLTGFLVWMETDDLEVKRQIDSASDQVRVMTVHGAKGLEAPIVLLPDSLGRAAQIRDDILTLDGAPVWKTRAEDMPAAMAATLDARRTAEEEERLRLLYVAMTRAEKWLIVAAAGDLPKDGNSWYQMIDAALDAGDTEWFEVNGLAVKRRATGDWEALPTATSDPTPVDTVTLEPCFAHPAAAPTPGHVILQASDLGGAKALPGEGARDEAAAKAYGTLVHHHLEYLSSLPPEAWSAMSQVLGADHPEDAAEAFAEAKGVLEDAALKPLFTADTLSEVALTADMGTGRLHGVIDRLHISSDRVLAVDFKTNHTVPTRVEDCPEGILRQMGAYARALQEMYPEKRIETAILWTKSRRLMHLPHDIVIGALENTPYLDAGAKGS